LALSKRARRRYKLWRRRSLLRHQVTAAYQPAGRLRYCDPRLGEPEHPQTAFDDASFTQGLPACDTRQARPEYAPGLLVRWDGNSQKVVLIRHETPVRVVAG
jgi:hypothetical protein